MNNFIKDVANITPSFRQLEWQKTEFYSFIHFGINTFTDSEWGSGNEDPLLFNPTNLNAHQWVNACKDAGMKGLILTCKHHDGFCLWPSKYTDHSVKKSPWKNGTGDVVKEVSKACKELGLKFGIYLSPWDRHEKSYGDSDAYNEFFRNQLKELLTNYGDIFCVWFDGACGEGPNGKKQIYDWKSYYNLIRKLQPKAVINVCGPDVRWCGNEAGHCRISEWSVVPHDLLDTEKIQEESQKVDIGELVKKSNVEDEDLGSRDIIKNAKKLIWYPAEVDTSIRPGWFYHSYQDNEVRSLEELLKIYYGSVGGNSCLLLNLPPNKEGLLHENDVKRLKEFGNTIKEIFKENLACNAVGIASETLDNNHDINNIFNDYENSFWCPKEGTEEVVIDIDLGSTKTFNTIVLMEHIMSGQRIERFTMEYKYGNEWKEFFSGTIVGYKRICSFNKVTSQYIKLKITNSRWCPTLLKFQVFLDKITFR